MATNGNGSKRSNGKTNGRWDGITRPYTEQDVDKLRGSMKIEYTLAQQGAERLWDLLQSETYVARFGRHDRQPGRAASEGRPESHLRERLASRRRRQ